MRRNNEATAEAARILALLWGAHSKPGRSGLTVRAIIAAALDLADAEGLAALSIRRVAERLNVGAMSLYTHIASKTELQYLMVDTVYGELYTSVEEPAQQAGGWRGALRFIATRNWTLYHRHPWLLQLVLARPVLGPNSVSKYEAELRPLEQHGLSDVEMDSILTLLLTHAEGTARAQGHLHQTERATGMTDTEWWRAHEPHLTAVFDPEQFPVAARVGTATGQLYQAASNPPQVFTFGLELILDGIGLLLTQRQEQRVRE